MTKSRASLVALTAILIAVTIVFTIVIRVPIAATQGYFNFSDVIIYFTSFTFGPWLGLIAGGVGTALGDIVGGYPEFAPLSFLAHGLEGLAAGLIARRLTNRLGLILGVVAGAVCMVGIYLLGEALVYGMGWGKALVEVPWNLLQNVVGGVVGIPLFYAVRRAYPPVTRIGQ